MESVTPTYTICTDVDYIFVTGLQETKTKLDYEVETSLGLINIMHRRGGRQVTWPGNYHKLPGNLCATWDASYQPPLWVDTSATWIFNVAADRVADYWWIIKPPRRLSWIRLERFVVRGDKHFHRNRYVWLLPLRSELHWALKIYLDTFLPFRLWVKRLFWLLFKQKVRLRCSWLTLICC